MNLWEILLKKLKSNSSFKKKLDEVLKRAEWSDEQIIAYRNKRLRNFIIEAYNGTAYYKKLFDELNIDPTQINNLEDLKKLPIITKRDVRENIESLTNKSLSKVNTRYTSGTTGMGLSFPSTMEGIHEQWAIWWRYRLKNGIKLNTWCGHFGGKIIVPSKQQSPPYWRINIPGKQIMFSAYHANEKSLKHYIYALNKYQPIWLHGYPSFISLIAKYLIDNNLHLDYKILFITTGAENLLENQKQNILKAFGILPLEHYGMAEACANLSQKSNSNGLIVDEDFSAVEFIPTDIKDHYKILGTNLSNPAFPLIRYEIGDVAYIPNLSDGDKSIRNVSNIDGRLEDYIVLKNGAKVAIFNLLFSRLTNIVEAQVHQSSIGNIRFRIVKSKNYSDLDEKKMLEDINLRLGNDNNIEIEYVESIPKSSTGKLRLVTSDLR